MTQPLNRQLFETPRRFEFFQAVRLLRRLLPGRKPVGDQADPDEEVVRFRSNVSLSFPGSDVVEMEPPAEAGRPAEMVVAFMGAAAPASFGSLPNRYAFEILDLARERDFAFRDFVEIFNHRFVSLFYRAWEKYRFPIRFEQGEEGFFEDAVYSLIGFGTPGIRGRTPFDDRALLFRAGLLAMRPVPVSVLEALVESYFGIPARASQFRAAWYSIDPSERSRLGAASSRLGEDLVLGESTRLNQFKFRLRVGPMSFSEYQDLLPAGPGFAALLELVRLAVPEEFDFECQLVLRQAEIPPLRLLPDSPVRLGWSSWLASGALDRDGEDAIFPNHRRPDPPAGRRTAGTPGLEAHP
jgi:type VI secretion system protein ImpH